MRYAAKLLFQFRSVKSGISCRRRICEERIVILNAESAKAALAAAKKRGRGEETSYRDCDKIVFFEFVGVLDLLDLGAESEPDEVWWELKTRVSPMERRDSLVPPEKELTAFSWPHVRKKSRGARRKT
jgi:hypothetical protein